MKNISLLPAEIKQYHSSSKKRNILILISLIVLALFILSYLGLSMAILQPQAELTAMQQERSEVQGKIQSLKQYEDVLNYAKGVETIISEAMNSNPDWGVLLKEVFNAMPQDVWVTGFNIKYENNTGSLVISGKADSNNSVSRWLSQLEKVKGITDVKCSFASKVEMDSNPYVNYEISAVILQSENYQLPDVGGELQ